MKLIDNSHTAVLPVQDDHLILIQCGLCALGFGDWHKDGLHFAVFYKNEAGLIANKRFATYEEAFACYMEVYWSETYAN